ncbi:MAG: hypothetical protein ABW215_08535 [Kibdelosporangium sp.]
MSEQELRDGLRLAVAEEPPMNFDLDDLVTTAERLMRRRRALVAVGASTAAVAVAAVAVPVALGLGTSGGYELPPANQPSVSIGEPSPTSKAPAVPRTVAELRQRGVDMQAHLTIRLPQVVVGATAVVPGLFGGEAEGAVSDGQTYLGSFVRFTLGAPTAAEVQVQQEAGEGMERDCAQCKSFPQPDGSVVVIHADNGTVGDNPEMKITSATHFRNDGTVTRVSSYNYDPVGGTEMVYQPNVAITDDQLITLATDPQLHF